jgi:rhodanese-related sulfurtransferase
VDTERIAVEEVKSRMDQGEKILFVDARNVIAWAYSELKLVGAMRILAEEIEDHVNELPKDRAIVIYCSWENENTSVRATRILRGRGFAKVYALLGGFDAWVSAGYPTEPKWSPAHDMTKGRFAKSQ